MKKRNGGFERKLGGIYIYIASFGRKKGREKLCMYYNLKTKEIVKKYCCLAIFSVLKHSLKKTKRAHQTEE